MLGAAILLRARQRLLERGQPVTPMYLDAEIDRMQVEEGRREGRRMGPAPRAEPDQVVRSAVRDDQGRILGRNAGAIVSGMVEKTGRWPFRPAWGAQCSHE